MARRDQLVRILAALDGQFAADDCRLRTSTAGGLDIARIELEHTAPEASNALKLVRWGLGREDKRD